MSDPIAGPVRYFHGQNLSVGDFVDEQRFHVAMQRRHNIGPHDWGIVHGLELRLEHSDGGARASLQVLPGFAVDGYGRELVLAAKRDVDLDLDTQRRKNVQALDVWLHYRVRESAVSVGEAGSPATASAARWDESPELQVIPQGRENGARPVPFAPEMDPVWGDEARWPVPLGQVRLDNAAGPDLVLDAARRRYTGLVGQQIRPPEGRARIAFGSGEGPDGYRFAVLLDPAENDGVPESGERRAFWIPDGDRLHAALPLTLADGLRLAGGALRFTSASPRDADPGTDAPGAADGCLLYRIDGEDGGDPELRIVLPDSPAAGLTVGAWSDKDQALRSAFRVQADGTVSIAGNLVVHGLINPPTDSTDETPAERQVEAATQAAFSSAIAARAAEAAIARSGSKTLGLAAWLSRLIERLLAAFNLGPGAGRQ